jgi:DNA polymerase-1
MEFINDNERKKLFSLFKDVEKSLDGKSVTKDLNRNLNSEVLLVDGMNTFLRAWASVPSLNEDGLHTGGISGFLKSVGYAIKLLNPTRCIIIFDGAGGSVKRRKIFPEYKSQKKSKIRLNRIYEDNSTADSEKNGIKAQLIKLVGYLQTLPINMIALDNVEADDTISYCALEYFKDSNVTIMSADRDFLQLASDRIKIWSPTKKKLYGPLDVFNEYKIHPQNFTIFRALDGDDSDNIPGIKGCGLKTVLKAFPFVTEDRKIELNELYSYSDSKKGKLKVYENILDSKNDIERNYSLMQLQDTQLQTFAQLKVHEILDREMQKLNRIEFSKLITEDGMWNNMSSGQGYQIWLNDTFGKLNNYTKV